MHTRPYGSQMVEPYFHIGLLYIKNQAKTVRSCKRMMVISATKKDIQKDGLVWLRYPPLHVQLRGGGRVAKRSKDMVEKMNE